MTGTLPSWSPLNDPQLSAQIQAGLQQGSAVARTHAQRDRYFLERYAWQEYPVKCGRWRVGDASSFTLTGGTNLSGPWTKKEWNIDLSWVLLLDPATRQPIAAHTVDWWREERPEDRHLFFPVSSKTASLWFAGDPRVGGMFTPAGNGHRAAFGHRAGNSTIGNYRTWENGPQPFEELTAKAASWSYEDKVSAEFGPWLADHPQQPPRPKRFGRTAWSNFV